MPTPMLFPVLIQTATKALALMSKTMVRQCDSGLVEAGLVGEEVSGQKRIMTSLNEIKQRCADSQSMLAADLPPESEEEVAALKAKQEAVEKETKGKIVLEQAHKFTDRVWG